MLTFKKNIMNIPEIKISLSFDKKVKKSELRTITGAESCVDVLREVFNKDTFDWTEEVVMLCLNRANKVVGFYKVSSGGLSSCILDPRVIFTIALNCGATSIILSHNHPSGNTTPSVQDKDITKKIKEAGKLLDIGLLDHIILTDDNYYSFMEEGIL
jgi:DNA repair protein RadC